jgi:hypothetical protein
MTTWACAAAAIPITRAAGNMYFFTSFALPF